MARKFHAASHKGPGSPQAFTRDLFLKVRSGRLRFRSAQSGFAPVRRRRHRSSGLRGGGRLVLARRDLAFEQALELVAGERLEFEKRIGDDVELSALFGQKALRRFVSL